MRAFYAMRIRYSVVLFTLLASSVGATSTGAQVKPESGEHNEGCAYEECALGIAPKWNGLMVVRGTRGEAVDNLHFFFPHDVSGTFLGDSPRVSVARPEVDSAVAHARRAVRLRRIGATLTDL